MNELLTGEDVERLAAEAGITLTELASRAGVAHTTLTRWKNRETSPSLNMYARIVRALQEVRSAA